MRVFKNRNLSCRLCLVKKATTGRTMKNIDGSRQQRRKSRENAAREIEPWLIATSLRQHSAKTVVKYYAQRMQIEESFRDIKNPRYGLCLRFTGTRSTQRLTILMLIAHVVYTLLYLIGVAAEIKGMQYSLQSNSVKHRRVLSLMYVACLLLRRSKLPEINSRELNGAIESVSNRIEHHVF